MPSENSTQSFAGLSFGALAATNPTNAFAVAKWNELEGPLARTEEGYGVPMKNLDVYRRAAISGNGAVLGSFADGAPFLIRKALGKGEVYFCATTTDRDWSSLADGSILVPMLQRMLSLGAKRLNSGVMLECGDAGTAAAETWTRVDTNAPANPRFEAGVFKTDNRFIAVNRPAAENNPVTMSPAVARKLFRDVPFQLHEERGRTGDRLQGEIWRVFVTLMLIFLILEGILILPPKAAVEIDQPVRARKPAEVAA